MEQRPDVEVTIRGYEEARDREGVRWLFMRTPPWGRTYPRPEPPPAEIEEMPGHFRCRLVATEMDMAGEAVVGFAAAGPGAAEGVELPDFVEAPERAARLYWLSVAPERWRLGLGRLVEEAVAWARAEGFEAVDVETTVEQRGAIALYAACGFVETGRYVLGGRWRQVWLRRDVR
jgi:GNAT superfamily N-acetyltransferase